METVSWPRITMCACPWVCVCVCVLFSTTNGGKQSSWPFELPFKNCVWLRCVFVFITLYYTHISSSLNLRVAFSSTLSSSPPSGFCVSGHVCLCVSAEFTVVWKNKHMPVCEYLCICVCVCLCEYCDLDPEPIKKVNVQTEGQRDLIVTSLLEHSLKMN